MDRVFIPLRELTPNLSDIQKPHWIELRSHVTLEGTLLEIFCKDTQFLDSFSSFAHLIHKNIQEKNLPPLSVVINVFRVWSWGIQKSA